MNVEPFKCSGVHYAMTLQNLTGDLGRCTMHELNDIGMLRGLRLSMTIGCEKLRSIFSSFLRI